MNFDMLPITSEPAYEEADKAIGYRSHELKTWPEQFEAVRKEQKRAELRFNDRDFRVGDHLLLHEWNPETEQYTGQQQWCLVLHVLHGPGFGLLPDYVMMSIETSPF